LSFVLAALILFKIPRQWSARFLGIGLICFALSQGSIFLLQIETPWFEPTTWVGLSLAWQALALPFWLLFSQLFWSDREKSGMERGLVLLSFGVAAVLFGLAPSEVLVVQFDPVIGRADLGNIGYLYPAYSLLISVVLLSNVEKTYKAARPRQRWQIKYTILAVVGIFGSLIYLDSQALLYDSLGLNYQLLFSFVLAMCSLMLFFSMFRGGVPEAQVYVSGGFLYRSLTLFLVGTYLVLTAFIAYGIRLVGGTTYLLASTLFVFIAFMALGGFLMSEEFRRKLRRFVYYSFFRQEYDYREKWMEVTQKFGSKITVSEICGALLDIMEETLGVHDLTLWIRNGEERTYTPLQSRGPSSRSVLKIPADEAILGMLRERREPISIQELDFDGSEGSLLRRIGPQVIVPLLSDQDLLGFVTLGRKISDESFSLEDLDLLRTIGRQAASVLQTARLSEQLLAAKEVESFHILSAFFVHDLKNFASTLSLVSENSLRRFDDPEFRADAMESIREITRQIQEMVSKLSAVSKQILLDEEPVDLASAIVRVIEEVRPLARGRLVADLKEDLIVHGDSRLLQNSIRNLVLNANDAINEAGGNGLIVLRGWKKAGSVFVAVEDNGCGISQDFLSAELFKPFRTTKPNGAGIGLFQVRKIVEAHRGTLEVTSREGEGTTFTLRFPMVQHSVENISEAKALNRR
jgi:putative PEP-CTERM system histidine kinase